MTSAWLNASCTAFEVFHSNQGSQGRLGRPSKQQLETVFGTSNEDEVVKQILEKGELKAGEGFSKELSGMNPSRSVFIASVHSPMRVANTVQQGR